MVIKRKPQTQRNIYTNQQNQTTPAKKIRNVWQDKGARDRARAVADQPAPLAKGQRALSMNNQKVRSQKGNSIRVKLIHTTLHLDPVGRGALEEAAEEGGLSISAVGNQVVHDWAISRGEQKYKTTLKAELRQMFREELAAFGHRIVFFLMRIAISAEQGRILITNSVKLILQMRGKYDEKTYLTMVDDSAKLARRNVLKKTPQLKSLLEEWETSFPAGRGEEAKA
jgi:hypothetical protein